MIQCDQYTMHLHRDILLQNVTDLYAYHDPFKIISFHQHKYLRFHHSNCQQNNIKNLFLLGL